MNKFEKGLMVFEIVVGLLQIVFLAFMFYVGGTI